MLKGLTWQWSLHYPSSAVCSQPVLWAVISLEFLPSLAPWEAALWWGQQATSHQSQGRPSPHLRLPGGKSHESQKCPPLRARWQGPIIYLTQNELDCSNRLEASSPFILRDNGALEGFTLHPHDWHPASVPIPVPDGTILHSYSTKLKPRNWHWYNPQSLFKLH